MDCWVSLTASSTSLTTTTNAESLQSPGMVLFALLAALAATAPSRTVTATQDDRATARTSLVRLRPGSRLAAAATKCDVNAGIQYFQLEGFHTAAVIEDGLIQTDIDDIFRESVRTMGSPAQRWRECFDAAFVNPQKNRRQSEPYYDMPGPWLQPARDNTGAYIYALDDHCPHMHASREQPRFCVPSRILTETNSTCVNYGICFRTDRMGNCIGNRPGCRGLNFRWVVAYATHACVAHVLRSHAVQC